MRFRGTPQPTPHTPARVGKRRWTRMALAPIFGGTFLYAVAAPPSTLHVDGILQGDLISVSPLYRAQVTQALVSCYTRVKAGQPLAMVNNFLMDEQFSTDYQTHMENLRIQEIAQAEGLSAATKAVQVAEQNYLAAAASQRKSRSLADAYDDLYQAGAIGRVARDGARSDLARATAESAALRQTWRREMLLLEQTRKGNVERIASLTHQLQLVDQTRKRVSVQPLVSPSDGQVLDCAARPDAVFEAGTPIYHVFDTDRAYVKAFVNPSEMAGLAVGMPVRVHIPGVGDALPGHVAALTLEASKLPEPLTRYFWQRDQWAQFRPVKITLDGLDKLKPEVRDKLLFDAKVSVRIPVSSWHGKIWERT